MSQTVLPCLRLVHVMTCTIRCRKRHNLLILSSFGVKSILDYSVEVDEAEDKKKEDKKAFTFKKVNYQPGITLQKVLSPLNSTQS